MAHPAVALGRPPGEANYFAAPFVLARSDIVGAETESWHEDERVWRRLLGTYPD
jgi:hypothetical protein